MPQPTSRPPTPLVRRRRSRPPEAAPGHEREELLRWVAELYYLQQRSQAEIAGLIGVSISTVSRLLAEARLQGIVTIQIADSRAGESPLERGLAERFGLRAVYVAPARVADLAGASRVAAAAGARLLPRLLPERGVLGFSGGYTIAQLAQALDPVPGSDYMVVPLQGNWADGSRYLHNDQVCRDAARRLNARALSLPAPVVVERAATRQALLDDRAIRTVTDRWADVQVAVVGIGASPSTAGAYQSVMGQQPRSVREELERDGVIGDLCAHMFDVAGRFLDHELSRRTLSIPLDQLCQVPCVVAVAGGAGKAESLLGALKTGVLHVLITDQLAADRLLSLADR